MVPNLKGTTRKIIPEFHIRPNKAKTTTTRRIRPIHVNRGSVGTLGNKRAKRRGELKTHPKNCIYGKVGLTKSRQDGWLGKSPK